MWRNRWAYLQQDGIAPVLIGEFGGRSIGSDSEGIWQRSFISFLEQGGFSYTCGVWNPDAWIGGLLIDDRGTLNQAKIDLLRASQAPLFSSVSAYGTLVQ